MIHNMLPKDTQDTIIINSIDNFNLRLNKAAQFTGEKFEFFKTDKGKVVFNVQPNYSKVDIEAIIKRYKDNISKLGIETKSIMLKPDWRLIVGLGNESVYETSMTLHHIYGIPYIPGSAIKGVVRSYIITEKFGKGEQDSLDLEHAEKRALSDQGFCDIFGCPNSSFYNESKKGNVIFFDAFPLEPPHIEPDIMNPHYSSYYSDSSGEIPPADYQNPIPIYFLTVKETPFEFIVGIREQNNAIIKNEKFKDRTSLEVVYEYMKKALSEHGIGAKTAVGYGYFEEVSKEYKKAHMTEKERRRQDEKDIEEKDKKRRDSLIDQLSKINFDKREHYPINDAIEYFKANSEDAEYKAALFDVILDYDKMSVLNTRQNNEGIVNNLFELYKFVKENNDKVNNDINLLEEKVPKIIKKLGSKNLKKKWKSYNQFQNE